MNTKDQEKFDAKRGGLDADIMNILTEATSVEERATKIDPILYEKAALRMLRWYHQAFHSNT